MSDPGPPPAEPRLLRLDDPAGRWVLAGTVLGSGMAMLDATVVNIALPRLGADLHASFAGLQWVLNGYTLALASLILLGGSFGDRFGRRRLFAGGVVGFVAASVLCAVAPTIGVLIVARILQGVAGALLTPGSLAIIQASFHPDDRARAIGAWSGLGGVTTAVGPFVGGWLIDAASWRWIFLLNVPLGAVVTFVAIRHMPESRDPSAAGRLDGWGALLGALGLAVTTYGLIDRTAWISAAGILLLGVFVAVEHRSTHPMLPLGIFRSQTFSATNAATVFIYGALGAALFLVGLVLQVALGYAPIEAGLATLPITATMLAFSARAGALARRIGPRIPMTVGPLVMSAGLLLFVRVVPGRSYVAAPLPALLVLAAGLALTVAPLTATALAAVDERHAGIASGVNNAVARAGSLIAVALIPIIAGFDAAHGVAPSALVRGFHRVALFSAVGTAVAAVAAWLFVRPEVIAAPALAADEPVTSPIGVDGHEAHRCTYHCAADGPPFAVDECPPVHHAPDALVGAGSSERPAGPA